MPTKEQKSNYNKKYREKQKEKNEEKEIIAEEKKEEKEIKKNSFEEEKKEKEIIINSFEEKKEEKDEKENFFLMAIKKTGQMLKDKTMDMGATLITMTVLTTLLKVGTIYMKPSENQNSVTCAKVIKDEPAKQLTDSRNSELSETCILLPVQNYFL
jgi:hypothetical protein